MLFRLWDPDSMLWSSFLQLLCPRVARAAPGDTGWLYDSCCYPTPSRRRNLQSEAGPQDLGLSKTSHSWFNSTCVVKTNHRGSSVKADQEGSAAKCACKSLAECISGFRKTWLRDVGEEVVFNVPFLWFSGEHSKFQKKKTCILIFFFLRKSHFLTIYCHFHVKGIAGHRLILYQTAAVSQADILWHVQLLRNSQVLLMLMDIWYLTIFLNISTSIKR